MRNLYFTSRLYILSGVVVALFSISFYYHILFHLAQVILLSIIALSIADVIILFSKKNKISCNRDIAKVFSLNDANTVRINVKNNYQFTLFIEIIDEVPYQFQMRNFVIKCKLSSFQENNLTYNVVPKSRGLYQFKNINVLFSSPLNLAQRKVIFQQNMNVPVYPSIVQMKKYQLHINASVKHFEGLKKIQRIGHSYEFDHIKNYVIGEDPRSINWKASSRRNELMVNHYEDEKSQQVYCILNKSRLMKMPFNGLSLMDYSINTILTISNIALTKSDRIGLISFSDKIGTVIKSNRNNTQLQKILNALYNESERSLDPNYELLYSAIRFFIPNRSLLFLFTNFETAESLERNLKMLRRINKFHLLVPIIFENTEVDDFISDSKVDHAIDIYYKVIARKMLNEKEIICSELKNHGIQYILSKPENLSINTINKYLELKSRGLI